MPLLLTHGWPGSFCEYLDLLPLLTDPQAHGGDPGDAFTVVVPSLPGFGFSAPPPPGGLTHSAVAALWHRLMADGRGYRRYAAHGSDLGAGVTAWLARAHADAVAGIHPATPGLAAPPAPWTPAEQAYFAEAESWAAEEGGYAHQQATKPSTLGAAWTIRRPALPPGSAKKILAWSSTSSDGQAAFSRDLLLETPTLYWATGTITSSMQPYWAYRHTPGAPRKPASRLRYSPRQRLRRRAGALPQAARELAERYFTITTWQNTTAAGIPRRCRAGLLAQTLPMSFGQFAARADAQPGGLSLASVPRWEIFPHRLRMDSLAAVAARSA